MKLDKDYNTIITTFKELCGNSSDIFTRTFKIRSTNIATLYFESLCSDDKIGGLLLKSISSDIKHKNFTFKDVFAYLENTIPNAKIKTVSTYDDLFFYLSSGFIGLIIDNSNSVIVIETRMALDRSISEPSSENIIRGPKDGFTENHMINLGLIRKRIKDPNLRVKEHFVGVRTKTKVSIVYIEDIADLKSVNIINNKLKEINIDGILDSGYIRDFLVKKQGSFPKMLSTERPDLVASSLLNGKIIILVDNTPFVLITPSVLLDFFHAPEDDYELPFNINFTKILRYLAFMISIFVPALYIAITTFNQEVIPNSLLISIAEQRMAVPFPTALEILILSASFEIIRESDIRTPNAMGSAMSIVGALVLGDAAIRAGIASPIVVIIVALSSISGLAFNDIDMVNAIRSWRLFFIIPSTFLGLPGFAIAFLIFIIKLASIESLGVSYLSPISPFSFETIKHTIFKLPHSKVKNRPLYLGKKNKVRLGDNIEKNN